MSFLKKYTEQKYLDRVAKLASLILDKEKEFEMLPDKVLQENTSKYINDFKQNGYNDTLLINSFANIREAAFRTIGLKAYKVQLMGAIVLFNGDIAEMKTGEGKTLTSIFAIYLAVITGNSVHVVTTNEYLAKRDMELNSKVFDFLNISTAVNLKNLSIEFKKNAYQHQVLYSTHSELGFDYLRDNLCKYSENGLLQDNRVQSSHDFIIIDEADSILIDEAKTPLILSSLEDIEKKQYEKPNNFVQTLIKNEDYEIDYTSFNIYLTEKGNYKAEKFFNISNLYLPQYSPINHRILQALRANFLIKKDHDYIVEDNIIKLIDKSTGRIMNGKSYTNGLHQAIEIKEHLKVTPENQINATITYQNYFRLYKKIGGMTGTAKTEEEELKQVYNMSVRVIPTEKPCIREDDTDVIYKTIKMRNTALCNEIIMRHNNNQPILIGTLSIEDSEIISNLLNNLKIKHNVLNAKNHQYEASIISEAGIAGNVTVATNMAGRGTDIKLDEEAKKAGGLAVLGLGRHESRRVDNQLRGRSGRQGDPGYTKFFLSLEDDLMIRFGLSKIKAMNLNVFDETKPIKSKILSKTIENAQKQIEGINYDQRASTLKYDSINSIQREQYYILRKEIAKIRDLKDIIRIFKLNNISINNSENFTDIKEIIEKIYNIFDKNWTKYLSDMNIIRQGITLRQYGKLNPIEEYEKEAYEMFDLMMNTINNEVVRLINV
ncbi:translocase [Erysipelatoclostridium ramosum]|uniref:Protein translocase subunit SecA n=1 Tax=Thomasclavelia ramosa TaxID=1547 RepID=A0AB35IPJ4_9FIRM|nr:translocase [Thomasclavelia ramosa]